MRSSTSSSEAAARPARWLLTWLLALAIVVAGWVAFERYWRAQGYAPSVVDSLDLWSQMRARVDRPAPPQRIALLGASRIQYGISPSAFRDEARRLGLDVDPVMLAVNGHYPLAALRDLADDPQFVGVALVGIDSRGMDRQVWDMQAPHVRYYHHDWSPSRELHRRLLTRLQEHVIAARPEFSIVTLIKRGLDGQGPPYRDYVLFQRDRSAGTDYARGNASVIRNVRIADIKNYYAQHDLPSPEAWLAGMREVVGWVERINARGGKVVFYREPLSGEHLELDEQHFPRAQYWDRLAAIMPATMIDFRDYPSLQFDTPDTSHVDIKDIDAQSRALVRVLREQHVF